MSKIASAALAGSRSKKEQAWVHGFPFYYGWIILFSGAVGMIMTAPGQTFGVSIFIERFITELDITRSWVSTLYAAGTLVGSLTLTYVGWLIDRYGPRTMIVVIAILFGVACLYMSTVRNWIMLGVGFALLRMLGQGALALVSNNVINQWWVRRRGTALGISGVFTALIGMGVAPNALNWLVLTYGWRQTYIILGITLLAFMTCFGYALYRNRPEEYGLLPDGDKPIDPSVETATDANSPILEQEENWTLQEALRTPVYWVFIAGLASIAMLGTGLTFHIVSIFADSGFSAELAALVYVPVAMTMAVTNLVTGSLVDGVYLPLYGGRRIHLQVRLRTLNAVGLFAHAISLWMVPYLNLPGLSMLFGVLLGFTFGMMRTVGAISWARYFGRLHLGAIGGASATILAASSSFGPMIMGIARDQLGSYNSTLNILAFFPLICGFACLFVDRPIRDEGMTG